MLNSCQTLIMEKYTTQRRLQHPKFENFLLVKLNEGTYIGTSTALYDVMGNIQIVNQRYVRNKLPQLTYLHHTPLHKPCHTLNSKNRFKTSSRYTHLKCMCPCKYLEFQQQVHKNFQQKIHKKIPTALPDHLTIWAVTTFSCQMTSILYFVVFGVQWPTWSQMYSHLQWHALPQHELGRGESLMTSTPHNIR